VLLSAVASSLAALPPLVLLCADCASKLGIEQCKCYVDGAYYEEAGATASCRFLCC
jgi:hypothetical protein